MSIRWMAVQFVGDTLRLPIVNKPDMDKPFGSSELEREVRRIVVNPFSDNPQTFVPEAENAKLLEVVKSMYYDLTNMTFPPDWVTDYAADMRELGVEA